ncbi:MAG: glycosyltransferase [Patescibacteria group bacterium]|jgi:glycosyltransferase involved in cell wall biosynthesis
MKVIHISTLERWPPGAIALNRLHDGLISLGIHSEIYAQNKVSTDMGIMSLPLTKATFAHKLKSIEENNLKRRIKKVNTDLGRIRFSTSTTPNYFYQTLNESDADVVHLHWVNNGCLSIHDIGMINKPIAWTLHGAWPFTGGCEITWDCQEYKEACENCPMIRSTDRPNLGHAIHNHKTRCWKNSDITAIAPSKWMADQAKKSSLFKNREIAIIPNGLNTATFRPIAKKDARAILGLGDNEHLILFGSENIAHRHKGLSLLIGALENDILEGIGKKIRLMTFGADSGIKHITHYPQSDFGIVWDEHFMPILYSAADVFVAPYLVDSFGQTLSESLSCGTPVVAFGTGGPLDIVDHQRNGYLAKPYCEEDLARGIRWVLESKFWPQLSTNARKKAMGCFDVKIVAEKHARLYKNMIAGKIA